VPLHTLRADIDYGLGEAKTSYGVIGIKAWVYKAKWRRRAKRKPAPPPRDGCTRAGAARGARRAQAREETGAAPGTEAWAGRPRPEGERRARGRKVRHQRGCPAPKTTSSAKK